jgi:enoyl-CoA hydratase/carnithine racemase
VSEHVFETLLWEKSGSVLTLTLNRPQSLNAFNAAMRMDICAAMDLADADDEVRAIVFSGNGRAFCAGADLSGGAETFDTAKKPTVDRVGLEPGRDGGGQVTLRLFASTKPLIGAINGAAVGIGATMMLPMDIRISSSAARIGFVFSRRGIVPDACASWFLPRIVGISRALEWSMEGRILSAEEALQGGLLREVCKPELLLERAHAIANAISANSAPVSIAVTRQLMWRMLGASHPMMAHQIESDLITQRGASGDAREGVRAFLDKRPAEFPGRVSTDMPAAYPWWEEPPYVPSHDQDPIT